MLGQKIKELRQKEGMTQKALADKLYVTAQAVSRWENEEVEPSVSTLAEISKVFGITLDELVGGEKVVEKVVEKEYVIKEQQPVLALCEQCNKPIFNKDEIVRKPYGIGQTRILCKSCDSKNNERERAERIENSKKNRIRSFVWGGIACAVLLMIAISLTTSGSDVGTCVGAFVLSVCAFTFVSCLILGNNFIGDMVVGVASWGFVRFPGLIFSLDLDGIIWFICVKLLFFILGIIFVIITTTLAILLGLALSIFVYPYAIVKNITKPDVE
ncbi:MAG: helix-turn-helix transcriptional regulator [Clostridia bacterium]|nr:helix-turn-helix transcriptional regulator [Clostridia bacterium]